MPPRSKSAARTPRGSRAAASSAAAASGAAATGAAPGGVPYNPAPKLGYDLSALRARHAPPADPAARLRAWATEQYFRYAALFVPLFLDWWEAILVNIMYATLAVLLAYGAYKQLTKGAELTLAALDAFGVKLPPIGGRL
jgi:hypothetical protein